MAQTDKEKLYADLAAAEKALAHMLTVLDKMADGGGYDKCTCGRSWGGGEPGRCAWHSAVAVQVEDTQRTLATVREHLEYPNGKPQAEESE